MTWIDRALLFSPLDYVAVTCLIAGWLWIGWRIENPTPSKPSVSALMDAFRRDWMTQMVTRQPRVFDAQLVGNMRQSTSFFASTSMIAIGGALALFGNTESLAGVAEDLAIGSAPAMVWEIKILIALLLLSNAFLKFVWSHRLFGYCAVLMAAVPNDPDDVHAHPRAAQAADISITAARSFNKALRTIYFALASTAWMLGPVALLLATAATLAILYRREFASHSRGVLLKLPPNTQT
ncbi:hypothetical protein TRL7639_00159 [Falsiruegeria litorea R37]|uniref:DUF599 domain-containing protein n=1 Tax=Falsiruegeria litorea R37 TaxID=1200284 RepID=A0A1Y5REK9_9RHOB|nr:DUF599 domain-containing protein [Falsiruegeria litorea]SLN13071.1 hypothetical protein TRL7639_00159 [Falsiruegeria litorea R37]